MAAKTDAQKAKAFADIAPKRMNKLLRAIEGLSKLAPKSRYSYTPKHIEKMEQATLNALKTAFSGFKGDGQSGGPGFKFD
jgi:hypothetical protein